MEYEDIRYAKNGPVAWIVLNRPDVLNAVRDRLWRELQQALKEAEQDDGIRVVVITGEGRAFSVGADLRELGELLKKEVDLERIKEDVLRMQAVTRQMVKLPKPVIAAINGYALGAGAEIAIASDIRLAASTAKIGFPEVKVGLFETNGVTYLLPRLVGLGRAKRMMLTGEVMEAREAYEAGLVEAMVAPEELREEAQRLAQQIAANAPVSITWIKRCLSATNADLETALNMETEALLTCAQTDDVREGATAFRENRPPFFQGK